MCSRYGIDQYTANWLRPYFRHEEEQAVGDVRPGNPAPVLISGSLAVTLMWGLPRKVGLIITPALKRWLRNSPHAGAASFPPGISTSGTHTSSASLFAARGRRLFSSRASAEMMPLPSSLSQLMMSCARFMTACP